MNQYDDDASAALSGWGAPVPFAFGPTDADVLIIGREVRLCGWSVVETAAAAATAYIRNGDGPEGDFIAFISLASGGIEKFSISEQGIRCDRGLFIDMVSGTIQGSIWVRLPHIT